MTSLIKHDMLVDLPVRSLGRGASTGEPSRSFMPGQTSAVTAPDSRVSILEATVQSLRQTLSDLEKSHARELADTRLEARQEALLSFKRDETEAISMLRTAATRAGEGLVKTLAEVEEISLLLAQSALGAIFADSQKRTELVASAIKRQMQQLRKEVVLGIRVSAADFATQEAVDSLARELGTNQIAFSRESKLLPGECHIALKLGHIEISLGDYWKDLQAFFTQQRATTR